MMLKWDEALPWSYQSPIENTCAKLKYDPTFPAFPPMMRNPYTGRPARDGEEVRQMIGTMRCKHCGADFYGGRCVYCGSDEYVDVEEMYTNENLNLYKEHGPRSHDTSTRTADMRAFRT